VKWDLRSNQVVQFTPAVLSRQFLNGLHQVFRSNGSVQNCVSEFSVVDTSSIQKNPSYTGIALSDASYEPDAMLYG
jgi:hypothetical protein